MFNSWKLEVCSLVTVPKPSPPLRHKRGRYVTYAKLATEPMIGDPMMTWWTWPKLQEEECQAEKVIGPGASGCQLLWFSHLLDSVHYCLVRNKRIFWEYFILLFYQIFCVVFFMRGRRIKDIYDKKCDENIIIILWRGNSFGILNLLLFFYSCTDKEENIQPSREW